jgi:hypothetical protein
MVTDIQYTQMSYCYKVCRWLRIKHIVYDDNDKNVMELYST